MFCLKASLQNQNEGLRVCNNNNNIILTSFFLVYEMMGGSDEEFSDLQILKKLFLLAKPFGRVAPSSHTSFQSFLFSTLSLSLYFSLLTFEYLFYPFISLAVHCCISLFIPLCLSSLSLSLSLSFVTFLSVSVFLFFIPFLYLFFYALLSF
jgi:hypothetical protein